MERFLLAASLVVISIFSSICNCQTNNNNVQCLSSDRNALLDFKKGLITDPMNKLSSWRGVDCCRNWRGIHCDNSTGGVTVIDLHRYDGFGELSGVIRPSLIQLKSLTHLDLSSNTFEGIPIPEFFGSLKNLRYLNLSNAGFSGIIPQSLGNLSSLKFLDVSNFGFPGLAVDDFQWITSLVPLRHLEMNGVDFSLVKSNWLQMLNMLPHLTELHLSGCGLSGSISSLSHVNFTSLAVIDLSFNSFSSMFPNWLVNITTLVSVDLSNCMLSGIIPLGFGELPSLRFLNLALNGNLSANASSLFKGSWQKIEVINFGSNKVHGQIPGSIENMKSLMEFDMSDNNVDGGVPSTIGSLCKLVNFNISGNNMAGTLPEMLEGTENCGGRSPLPSLMKLTLSNNQLHGRLPDWLGQLRSLKELSLAFNLFGGPIPASLGSLQNLTYLSLAANKLTGHLPEIIGKLSELVVLDLSANSLSGILSDLHFSKLRKLKVLSLSSNSFILNVSTNWVPPFQIRNLNMGSCRLGPSFPRWLKSQNETVFLDISNASISGSIPAWFWDHSFNLLLLNVSYNQLEGHLPSSFEVTPYADIDLSFNLFEGPVPLPSAPINLLDLSHNRFQGPIPHNISDVLPDLIFLSLSGNQLTGQIPSGIGNMSFLSVVDLSGNSLTGIIPPNIGKCSNLKVLDLGNNSLSGEIPSSIGQLNQLQSLHLHDNLISGNLPSSLKHLSTLEILDVRKNRLEGNLPLWLDEGFTTLRILDLRSNAFSWEILYNFSNLTSLEVLDLAENNLTGRIPTTLGNLKAMAQDRTRHEYSLYGTYRGMFTKTSSFVTIIDISGNNLSGDFPVELTNLQGLMVLNLSRNHINGQIPESISRLHQIASLDLSGNDLFGSIPESLTLLPFLGLLNLSQNNLSGQIPESISKLVELSYLDLSYNDLYGTIPNSMNALTFLVYLDLSHNNLSGRIPRGDQMLFFFWPDSYKGNPGLCGVPVSFECPESDGPWKDSRNENDDERFVDEWFYLSVGLGFAVGILVPCAILVIKNTWSDKYFLFLDEVVSKLLSCMGLGNRKNLKRVTNDRGRRS